MEQDHQRAKMVVPARRVRWHRDCLLVESDLWRNEFQSWKRLSVAATVPGEQGQELIGAEFGAQSCLLQSLHRLLAATGLVVIFFQKHPAAFLHEVHLGVRKQAPALANGLGMVIWPLLVTRIGA